MNFNKLKSVKTNQKGMTLIELIIVVALIGIIGATLVPTFSTMTTKARITSDIATIKTFQRQVDVYEAEFGKLPGAIAGATTTTEEEALKSLIDNDYMDTKYVNVEGEGETVVYTLALQTRTEGAADAEDAEASVEYIEEDKIFKIDNLNAKYVKALKEDTQALKWLTDETIAAAKVTE